MKKLSVCLMVLFLCFIPTAQALANPPAEGIMDGGQSLNGEIIVNSIRIDAPTPYLNGYEGVVMVPVRAIAESLGIAVEWNAAEREISVGGALTIRIGLDYYTNADGVNFTFGPAPEIRQDRAYVPISFFTNALPGYYAYVTDGTIIVEDKAETQSVQEDNAH